MCGEMVTERAKLRCTKVAKRRSCLAGGDALARRTCSVQPLVAQVGPASSGRLGPQDPGLIPHGA